jgi:hypothetical protein
MRFYTPEKTELIVISSVKPHKEGLVIEGKIMGTMPMKAILRPSELRKAFRLLSMRTIWTMACMLFRR